MRSSLLLPSVLLLASLAGAEPPAVRVGLLLPADEALARETSRGAALAADAGVALLEHRVRGPWGSEAAQVVKMIYDEGAAGVVTAPDRASTHLALQVAVKARVPVVTTCAAATLTRVPLPWAVRAVPDERAVLDALLAAVPAGERRLGFLVAEGREGERAAGEIRAAAKRAGWTAAPGDRGDAVLVAEGPSPWIRTAAARVRPLLLDEATPAGAAFGRAYRARFGEPPTATAAAAHDAVRMLVRAARASDGTADAVLRGLLGEPTEGATGTITLDASGDRAGPVRLERTERKP